MEFLPSSTMFLNQLSRPHITNWTYKDNKLFETALALFDTKGPDRWSKVASMLPGKTAIDVVKKYKELEADIYQIESGSVPIPEYRNCVNGNKVRQSKCAGHKRSFQLSLPEKTECSNKRPRKKQSPSVSWPDEDHLLFLEGIEKHGKGKWTKICNGFLPNRTPTQLCSHAQKFFAKQKKGADIAALPARRRQPAIMNDPAQIPQPAILNRVLSTTSSIQPNMKSTRAALFTAPQTHSLDKQQPSSDSVLLTTSLLRQPNMESAQVTYFTPLVREQPQQPSLDANHLTSLLQRILKSTQTAACFTASQTRSLDKPRQPSPGAVLLTTSLLQPNLESTHAAEFTAQETILLDQQPSTTYASPLAEDDFSELSTKREVSSSVCVNERKMEEQAKLSEPARVMNFPNVTTNVENRKGRDDEPHVDILGVGVPEDELGDRESAELWDLALASLSDSDEVDNPNVTTKPEDELGDRESAELWGLALASLSDSDAEDNPDATTNVDTRKRREDEPHVDTLGDSSAAATDLSPHKGVLQDEIDRQGDVDMGSFFNNVEESNPLEDDDGHVGLHIPTDDVAEICGLLLF